jgi:hypothetical protein
MSNEKNKLTAALIYIAVEAEINSLRIMHNMIGNTPIVPLIINNLDVLLI